LDSITYAKALEADVGVIDSTVSSPPPESTFPYEEAGPPASAPNTTLVGAIVGAIFGTFLLVGLFGLFILKRSGQARRRKKSTGHNRGKPNAAGGQNKLSNGSGSGEHGDLHRGPSRGRAGEYKYSGPRQLNIPLSQPSSNRNRWQEPTRSGGSSFGGGLRSAIGTFVSRSSSENRSMGRVGSEYAHAITTDSPQPASRAPMEWGQRAKADKHASIQTQGSTLDAEGVLERMMMHSTSSHAGSPSSVDFDYSLPTLHHYQQPQQPQNPLPRLQNAYVVDHPFKASVAR
ncbi:hypothetical protein FRC17_002133, partial [Serendipita sp. 399]